MPPSRRGGPRPPGGDDPGSVGTLPPPGGDDAPPRGSRRRFDPAWEDWRRPKRWPGILLTSVVVLAFIGVVVWHYRPHVSQHHAPPNLSHPGAKVMGAYVPLENGQGASVRRFHGTQNATGLKFATDGSLLIMHAKCVCAYNFVVTITNAAGAPMAFPVTAQGLFDGSMNVTLPAGTYDLTVVAPSPALWTVQLVQPHANPPPVPTPFKWVTFHESVLGPFASTDRFLYFRFLSASNQTARVYIVDAAGVHVEQAFAGRTAISAPATLPNPPSPYYVEVDAAGEWELRVQHSAAGG